MELQKLQQFIAIIEHQTIGAAARSLGVSQPTLSRNIQILERDLGAPLFERKKLGMSLTTFGRLLESRARIMCAEATRTESLVREHLQAQRGRIVIGAGPTCTKSILPNAITNLLELCPHVEIVLVEGLNVRLYSALLNGEIEYALLTLPPRATHPDLKSEILVRRSPALILSAPDHPFAAKRVLHAREVLPGPWILPHPQTEIRIGFAEQFAKLGLPPPQASVEYSFGFVLPYLLYRGNFLTIAPELFAHNELKNGSLRSLRVRDVTFHQNIGVVYRSGFVFTPAAQKLLEEIRQICNTISE